MRGALAAGAGAFGAGLVAVLAVVGRTFAGVPAQVEDAADWWLRFALPTALWSLVLAVPVGLGAAAFVWRRTVSGQ